MKTLALILIPVLLIIGATTAVVTTRDSDSQEIAASINSNSYVTLEQYNSNPEVHADKRKVYFFHAKWCVTCRALENSIQSNAGDIPADVVIIKADFDEETELKKEFEVRIQHTLVQIRDDRSIKGKWVAQPNLQSVLSDLQAS